MCISVCLNHLNEQRDYIFLFFLPFQMKWKNKPFFTALNSLQIILNYLERDIFPLVLLRWYWKKFSLFRALI